MGQKILTSCVFQQQVVRLSRRHGQLRRPAKLRWAPVQQGQRLLHRQPRQIIPGSLLRRRALTQLFNHLPIRKSRFFNSLVPSFFLVTWQWVNRKLKRRRNYLGKRKPKVSIYLRYILTVTFNCTNWFKASSAF